jgi:branched-chain amino acid transport system ATP-binding protein
MPEAKEQLATIPPEPGAPKGDPILVMDEVTKAFGGLRAVDVDHLEVEEGVITGMIGPNGAGKTTLFNVLTGFEAADRGSWTYAGEELRGMAPYKIADRGMVRTFQLTKALSRLSVIDNMKLGATGQVGERIWEAPFRRLWAGQEAEIEERADQLLERFKLDRMRDEYAGTLSGGQRKLLEMARALMVRPRLVMLDEPMAGVNTALKQNLLEHILELPSEGISVVFIEHDMDVVMSISDWVICLAQGIVIAEGPPRSIGGNDAVIDAYLGAHHDEPVVEQSDQSEHHDE